MSASAQSAADVKAEAQGASSEILKEYDAFLFDCDGTLYHADAMLPFVAETIQHLRSLQKKVLKGSRSTSK